MWASPFVSGIALSSQAARSHSCPRFLRETTSKKTHSQTRFPPPYGDSSGRFPASSPLKMVGLCVLRFLLYRPESCQNEPHRTDIAASVANGCSPEPARGTIPKYLRSGFCPAISSLDCPKSEWPRFFHRLFAPIAVRYDRSV